MINNLHILQNAIPIKDGELLTYQVISRKKDRGDGKSSIVHYQDWIRSWDALDIELLSFYANHYGARVYVSTCLRKPLGIVQVCSKLIQRLCEMMVTGSMSLHGVQNQFWNVMDNDAPISDKNWIIDVDDESLKQVIMDSIPDGFFVCETKTPNGCHIICKPFDLRDFKWRDMTHKKGMTILLATEKS
jgi:hypothetical protein